MKRDYAEGHELQSQDSPGAELSECLFCGADISNNTHPNAVPDFCDTRCEDAYYEGGES